MRTVVAVVALVACLHAGLWSLLQRQHAAPSRADLKLLSLYTRTVRTYSSTGGVELVPGIAAEFGLKVTVGIWIDKNEKRNEREIAAAVALAKRYSNVNALVV